ncbi:ABC-type transport auxiliary lipoprotein family protein [Halovibrio sp. HP20-50]|uniref:ABC-type transport auxiliary lipoprotein family protein n=1 Tax=Halovibrio sp. HP20-59 TaxID=3080275 RepID=UPI00294B5509|nr:ABC-type transport auxiliary lipoprotein family protein [Halovibrio sp. HP20-59]MEA2117596.1 ABC-type transport auxiliary lipoprotein family protein [Halovibrio sp. HP20-59]
MSFRLTTIAILSAALLLSSGCSILPDSEPATLYRLPASDLPSVATSSNSASQRLGVAAPEAGHLLSSNRIVVYPERNIVNVYESARWSENAPDLLQARLINGLQQSQLFASVGSDRLPHELLILSELRHFQSEYDNGLPSAKIALDVQLIEAQSRKPLAAHSLSARSQASSVEIADVVEAFGRASDELTEQLANWLATQSTLIDTASQ